MSWNNDFNYEIIQKKIAINGYTIFRHRNTHYTRENVLVAIKQTGKLLKYFPKYNDDREIVLIAKETFVEWHNHISKRLADEYKKYNRILSYEEYHKLYWKKYIIKELIEWTWKPEHYKKWKEWQIY